MINREKTTLMIKVPKIKPKRNAKIVDLWKMKIRRNFCNQGTLYHHFSNKSTMVFELRAYIQFEIAKHYLACTYTEHSRTLWRRVLLYKL